MCTWALERGHATVASYGHQADGRSCKVAPMAPLRDQRWARGSLPRGPDGLWCALREAASGRINRKISNPLLATFFPSSSVIWPGGLLA